MQTGRFTTELRARMLVSVSIVTAQYEKRPSASIENLHHARGMTAQVSACCVAKTKSSERIGGLFFLTLSLLAGLCFVAGERAAFKIVAIEHADGLCRLLI